MEEAGVKGFDAVSWHMIVGPAGMPKDIVDKLYDEFHRIATTQNSDAQAKFRHCHLRLTAQPMRRHRPENPMRAAPRPSTRR